MREANATVVAHGAALAIAAEPPSALSHRLSEALDLIDQGLSVIEAGRLVLRNRRYGDIFGLSPQQLPLGLGVGELADRIEARLGCAVPCYRGMHGATASPGAPAVWLFNDAAAREIRVRRIPIDADGWIDVVELIVEQNDRPIDGIYDTSLQEMLDLVPDYLWVKDSLSRFVLTNKTHARDVGYEDTRCLLGIDDFSLHPKTMAQQFREAEERVLATGEPMIDREEVIYTGAGKPKWLLTSKMPMRNRRGDVVGIIGISKDITERKRSENWRDGQAALLEKIAMSAPIIDILNGLMLLVESQIAGISASVLLYDPVSGHLCQGASPNLPEAYANLLLDVPVGPCVGSCGTAAYRREQVIVTDIPHDPLWRDYTAVVEPYGYLSCWSTPILSHYGELLGTFALYSKTVRAPTPAESAIIDMTTRIAGIALERKRFEDRIHFMATHDALTGLPNRSLLSDRLGQAIALARRSQAWVSVAFIDLDNFKVVNDSLGHSAGDDLLKTVAKRMVANVRTSDTVVRIGGDEFVIILIEQPQESDGVAAILKRIRAVVAEPIRLSGHDIHITMSIGVANFPLDGPDIEALLANADAAMYRAKELGRDSFQFYTPEMNVKNYVRVTLQEELRTALARRELRLQYQPIVTTGTSSVVCVEALLRWQHPVRGLLPPADFLSVAEETGLILPIGDWVLDEVCARVKAWHAEGLDRIAVALNLSARQFKDDGLAARIGKALATAGLDARFLTLEIAESTLVQDVAGSISKLADLRRLGVGLSIDNFGADRSCLGALKSFCVDRLKLDRSIVARLAEDPADQALVGAMIVLGQNLGMRVVAAGVETSDQASILAAAGCNELQGFRIGMPVDAGAIVEVLMRHAA
ncbi:MAG: EAL domain-containing protein [Ancalomicrobiaceae bacterium]|nr:EAL domain-containing protein [Ancalomicrobiaceae bacterium]